MQDNVAEFTVSELAFALKRTVEDAYGFVRVRGELSGFKRAGSGHCYFALKDDKAVIDSVCWRNTLPRLRFEPEDGLEVICTGKLSTYPGRSRYQLIVEQMEPAGAGALMALLEERRRRFEAEGLFAAERKHALPFLPEVIGVVTSPSGAVIRDIIHRLRERFPRRVLLWPVIVQGEGAAEQVAAAIAGFDALAPGGTVPRPDLVIVARGGGSIEDLWAFNEEVVVRAAAACSIPLISAVGHETDTTLIDFVSDRRAPTPTAAAEIAVPVRLELLDRLDGDGNRLRHAEERLLRDHRRHLDGLRRGLPEPRQILGLAAQRLDDLGERLRLRTPARVLEQRAERLRLCHRRLGELVSDRVRQHRRDLGRNAMRLQPAPLVARIEQARTSLERDGRRLERAQIRHREHLARLVAACASRLDSVSHERVLERGYAIVRARPGDELVASAERAHDLAEMDIHFADGVVPVSRRGAAGRGRGGTGARGTPRTKQGVLL